MKNGNSCWIFKKKVSIITENINTVKPDALKYTFRYRDVQLWRVLYDILERFNILKPNGYITYHQF